MTAGAGVVAVFAEPAPPPELARTLDLANITWKAVHGMADVAEHEPADGWAAAVVDTTGESASAWAFVRSLRKREPGKPAILILVNGSQLHDLDLRDDLFNDFCLSPFHPSELEARLRHLLWSGGAGPEPETVEYSDLVLNLETYQATVAGRALDMTYMEHELLKFLVQHPGKVFTREMLLNRVWGYEYYGGARTVDVHIRRLRAKLGEEHANLIQTVRSVGYRFGQTRWGS